MLTLAVDATLNLDRHATTLVVCTIVANGLATGAQCHDGHLHAEQEVIVVTASLATEDAAVVHQCSGPCHRSLSFDKIRESNFDPSALRFETILQSPQHRRQSPHRHLAAVLVENLQKPTHVGALEVVRQVHRHRDLRDRVLLPLRSVEYNYRVEIR